MIIEPLPDQCERGSHAVAYAEGTHDETALRAHGARLAERFGISSPRIDVIMLNDAQRPTTGKYLLVVKQNSR